MIEDTLLHCPFCGESDAQIKVRSCTGIARYYQVECSECGATSHGSFHLDPLGAAKEWNTRALKIDTPFDTPKTRNSQ